MTALEFSDKQKEIKGVDIKGFKEFLMYQNYSACTMNAYLEGMDCYVKHGFTSVSFLNGNAFRDMLVAEGKKGKTVNLRVASINAYHKWVGLPIIKAIRINEDPFAKDGMELDDYFYLLDCLLKDGKYEWYVTVKLLASSGLRIGEAVQVTFGDIRRGSCTVYGKGGKPRTAMFSHALRETLFMFIRDKADDDKVIPHTTGYVRNALLAIKRRYHINVCCSPHEYRRLFARQMFETTSDPSLIQGLLGHESLKMTYHYIRKTEKQAIRMYARAQNW